MNSYFNLIYFILISLTFWNSISKAIDFESSRHKNEDNRAYLPEYNPSQVSTRLNAGFPDDLKVIKARLKPHKSYLIFMKKLPSIKTDFRSAELFHKSLLGNSGGRRLSEVGHVMVGWSCPRFINDKNQLEPHESFISLGGEYKNQILDMILKGWGITALFSSPQDGILFLGQENYLHLKPLLNKSAQAFTLITEVSDADCAKTINWTKSFAESSYENENATDPKDKIVHLSQFFGLQRDPRKLNGGGCSSFALRALENGQFFNTNSDFLFREVRFNPRLFGFAEEIDENQRLLRDPYVFTYKPSFYTPMHKIRISSLLSTSWNPEAKDDTSETTLNVADPELMILYFRTLLNNAKEYLVTHQILKKSDHQIKLMKKSSDQLKRVVISRNYKSFRPDPFEYKHKPFTDLFLLDENFDPKASQVVSEANQWFTQKVDQSYEFQFFLWHDNPILLFEKN